jgi:hypothetical protein
LSAYLVDQERTTGRKPAQLLANTAACDFYWRRGGRPITSAFTRIGGERLEKVAFTWR